MAQTVEEIAELINNLHDENKRNNESFEKVLANINAKIELMSDDANADAIRLYFSELKKSMEDKYADASFKFEEIQRISSNLRMSWQKGRKLSYYSAILMMFLKNSFWKLNTEKKFWKILKNNFKE